MRRHLVDPGIAEVAASFWEAAGGRPKPPIDLQQALALVLPLDVVLLARVTLARVEAWLAERGCFYGFGEVDRRLYGLLIVYRGAGFIFIDGTDDGATRRFTLAHEVAHFLLDYVRRRQRVARRLGDGVLDVLDGLRAVTQDERLAAVLANVEVEPHVHLLTRPESAATWHAQIDRSEERADWLALELLAPAAEIDEALEEAGVTTDYFRCVAEAEALLRKEYDLPALIADDYARRLARAITGGPSLLTAFAPE